MLIPSIREAATCPDIDGQCSAFTGTRRAINIWPWLNYPFSLLLLAASRVWRRQTPSLQQLLFPTSTPLPRCASTTVRMAGHETDSAEKQPASKIQFPNTIYYKAAQTAVWALRKKPSRGWKRAAWVLLDQDGTVPQDHGLGSQNAVQVEGTESILIWDGSCDKASLPSLWSPVKRMVHAPKVRHEHSHSESSHLSLNNHGITTWFLWRGLYFWSSFYLGWVFLLKNQCNCHSKGKSIMNYIMHLRHPWFAHLFPHSKCF